MNQDREVPDPVGNLMRGDGEGRHQAERKARQKGRCDQHTIQCVVNAVANDDQHARRRSAAGVAVVCVRVRIAVIMSVCLVRSMCVPVGMVVPMSVSMIMPITIRVRVPPQHELLDDKEHTETHQHRGPDRVRALRPNTLHRLR